MANENANAEKYVVVEDPLMSDATGKELVNVGTKVVENLKNIANQGIEPLKAAQEAREAAADARAAASEARGNPPQPTWDEAKHRYTNETMAAYAHSHRDGKIYGVKVPKSMITDCIKIGAAEGIAAPTPGTIGTPCVDPFTATRMCAAAQTPTVPRSSTASRAMAASRSPTTGTATTSTS